MKRSLFFLLAMGLLFSACMKDSVKEHYTFYRPVYHTRDEVRNNIKSSTPVPIQQTGKIVVKDNYVFLNEIDKGIHVINMADPSKPVNMAFIEIPGCVDLAINGVNLYADCYTDLVTLDISNPANISVKQFLPGVFPNRIYNSFRPDTTKIITEWVKVDTVIEKRFEGTFAKDGLLVSPMLFMSLGNAGAAFSAMSSSGIAIAGSLARFALQNDRMYTVSNNDLKVFNVTIPAAPSYVTKLALTQGGIETIFPYKNKLFIGAQTGMYIYGTSNPDAPQKEGQFVHAQNCDPVIVDDKYAYVTLSSGNACRGGFQNQMDVIDISNLSNPVLVKSYNLTSPKGLSKDGNTLLICDGKDGLKIFNASNASQVSLMKQVPGFEPNDVIALQGIAIAVAKDGLYFIDYSNPYNASVISKIQITKN
ncbi:MAG: hypothetical protein V4557_09040 [Bacteroidota bacterium]